MGRLRKIAGAALLLIPMMTFSAITAAAHPNGADQATATHGHASGHGAAGDSTDTQGSGSDHANAEASASAAVETSALESAGTSSSATTKHHASTHQAGGTASNTTTHPPGNNGTIKIHTDASDTSPHNVPHPGCHYGIAYFGYEQGDLWAHYTAELWPPSGHGVIGEGDAFVGEDANGGGADFDGYSDLSYTVAAAEAMGTPNPNQGYHIRITVHVPAGSQGADVKHKMLWVNCATETTPPSQTTSPPTETTTPPTGTTTPPSPTVGGTTVTPTTTSPSGTVLGTTVTPPGGGSGSASVAALAFTGSNPIWPMLVAMLALLLAGTATLRFARRIDRTRAR